MTCHTVEFAAVARDHARTIAAWWEANRPQARDLFRLEFAAAVAQLSRNPNSGSPYPAVRPADTRRLLLRRAGYHVYYTVDEGLALVTVRAVWHAARGRLPRL